MIIHEINKLVSELQTLQDVVQRAGKEQACEVYGFGMDAPRDCYTEAEAKALGQEKHQMLETYLRENAVTAVNGFLSLIR